MVKRTLGPFEVPDAATMHLFALDEVIEGADPPLRGPHLVGW